MLSKRKRLQAKTEGARVRPLEELPVRPRAYGDRGRHWWIADEEPCLSPIFRF